MFGKRFAMQRAGRPISAAALNRPRKALERLLGLHVAPPLVLQWFDGQPMIWLDRENLAPGLAMTPSGGIPAATSTGSPPQFTAGSAACTPYVGDDTGTISADPGTDTITIYNLVPAAVGGSKLVVYMYINDLPYVVLEPC